MAMVTTLPCSNISSPFTATDNYNFATWTRLVDNDYGKVVVAATGLASSVFALLVTIRVLGIRTFLLSDALFSLLIIIRMAIRFPQSAIFLGMTQLWSTWMLLLASYRALRALRRRPVPKRHTVIASVCFLLASLLYHLPLFFVGEEHASLVWRTSSLASSGDNFKVFYFYFLHFVLFYALPFSLIAYLSKSLLEETAQLKRSWHVCHRAIVVAAFLFTWQLCSVTKCSLLVFHLLDHCWLFTSTICLYYDFINAIATFLIIMRPCFNFFLVCRYHSAMRRYLIDLLFCRSSPFTAHPQELTLQDDVQEL